MTLAEMVDKEELAQASAARVLDARGLFCPEPVMMLHKMVREMSDGELVRVFATDPSTQRDIPKFCSFLGYQLLESRVEGEQSLFTYLIGKSEPSES